MSRRNAMTMKSKTSSRVVKMKKHHHQKKLTPAERHAHRSKPGTFTSEKRDAFLEAFAQGGTVQKHARNIKVSRVTIYRTIRTDAEFAARFRLALELNTDQVEDSLHQEAAKGNITAMFGILRARRPGVWRESYGMKIDAGDGFAAAFATAMKETLSAGAPATADGPRKAVH